MPPTFRFNDTNLTKIWIGSPTEVLLEDSADEKLAKTNDAKYWTEEGITKVDPQRWKTAQKFEEDGWLRHWVGATSDRNDQHKIGFRGYKTVPQDLGNVIEIGCGPFTQLQTIIQNRTAKNVTLLDPLLEKYKTLSTCTYKNGKFQNHNTILICDQAENLNYVEAFDTAICINVLEHVQNAKRVLAQLYQSLVVGGIIIFGERCYDGLDIRAVYDVGHPIKVKMLVFRKWESQFKSLFSISPKFDDPLHQEHYFIGKKI